MINKFGNKRKLISVTYTEVLNDILPWKPTCARCGYHTNYTWNLRYEDNYSEQVCDDCILDEEIDDMGECILKIKNRKG